MTLYLYRKTFLYCKARRAVTLTILLAAALAVLSAVAQAQFRAPQPERKTPRAVGVLETFPSGVRRLVPVIFYYEKHYYDADLYRATPVPFTLYPETVYEVQQFGKAIGTFTVLSAAHSADPSVDQSTLSAGQWFGNGRFRAAPDAAALAKRKAVAHKIVLDDPTKPVLHRREGSEGDNPVAHSAPAAKAAQGATQGATQGAAQAEDDPERPRLHRSPGSDADASAKAAAPIPTQASAQAQPTAAPASMSSVAAAPTAVAELTPSDDSAHPVLRRGKPQQEQGGRDLPDFHPSGKPSVTSGFAGGFTEEASVKRQVAVSDAGPSEPQELIYVCTQEQRQQMEAAARELAQAELRRMAAQRGLVMPTPSETASPAKKKAASQAPPPELKLEEEQFVPYDLDYNNYATVVFSARYTPEAVNTQDAAASIAPGKSWVVTVIAREDDGKLVKLYSAVSNPRELDLYPEVKLVDAVDPDGYGRYSLLFREQKRDGVSWLLGRTTGYELQTVFETAVR